MFNLNNTTMRTISFLFSLIFFVTLTSCFSNLKQKDVGGTGNAISESTFDNENNENMANLSNPTDPKDFVSVDSLISIRQYKNAEKLLGTLLTKYKSLGQWDGYIRAVMTLARIKSENENGTKDAIAYLESEVVSATFPARQILLNVTAHTYASYLNANRYQLEDVTSGEGLQEDDDFETWSKEKLLEKIDLYYDLSIADEKLRTIPIRDIDLITTQSNADLYRPSLYSFLAHQMLDYLADSRNYIEEPVYKFEIRGSEWFAPYEEFIAMKLEAKDSTSRVFHSLKIYQQLLQHHLSNGNEEALRRIDLERLNFVYEHSVDPLKDRDFKAAIQKQVESGAKQDWKAAFEYRLIELELAIDKYSSDNPDQGDRFLLNKMIERLKKLSSDYPNNKYGIKAQNKIASLQARSVSIQGESVQFPGKPFLLVVQYANLTEAEVNIYKLTREQFFQYQFNRYERNSLQEITGKNVFKTVKIDLPDFADHRSHRVEVKMDGLDQGIYLFVPEKLPNNGEYYSETAVVQFSNLAVMRNNPYGTLDHSTVVIDRMSGMPLEGVKTEIYTYSYNTRNIRLLNESKSDKNGFVTPKVSPDNNYFASFTKGGDQLIDLRQSYPYRFGGRHDRSINYNVFTDRAIYRPGQIIYFKAILYSHDEKSVPHIIPNKKVTVSLRDVNNQEVSKGTFVSNEFGSLHGNFTVPSGVLTGVMSIYIDGQHTKGIQVEEYKRPKFEVKIDTITQAYVLNDKVRINGKALNYAGNAVDGAKGVFTVTRRQIWRYYFWNFDYFRPSFPSNEMIIANGEITTETDGSFTIVFDALADESISKEIKPKFSFDISVDITDINGETQSGSTNVLLGYDPYNTDYNIAGEVEVKDLRNLVVDTKNSAFVSVPTNGRLRIELLTSSNQYLRNKLYAYPERVTISREEYKKLWPYESYLNEADRTTWSVKKTIFDRKIKSATSPVEALKSVDFEPGDYRIVFDVDGMNPVSNKEALYVSVKADGSKGEFALDRFIFAATDKPSYQVGMVSNQTYKTRNTSGKLLYEFYFQGKLLSREWLNAASALGKTLKINEEYRGGVTVIASAYGFGRAQSVPVQINVPWSNKDLQVKLKTFRDKLEPGAEETWELVVSGPAKEKVLAEVIASMYDASLDVFSRNYFNTIGFPDYHVYYSYSDHHNGLWSLSRHYSMDMQPEIGEQWRNYLDNLLIQWHHTRVYRKMMMSPTMAGGRNFERNAQPEAEMMADAVAGEPTDSNKGAGKEEEPSDQTNHEVVPPSVRSALEETVFFYPDLHTDKNGDVVLRFRMKEALTRWRLQLFAHTKDLMQATLEQEVTTSKELMVFPNLPRYFRENDKLEVTAKVVNMNGLSGIAHAKLELLDAVTLQPLAGGLIISSAEQTFALSSGQSSVVSWEVQSPALPVEAVTIRITAWTDSHTDGEENTLPVLSNRMMVTETMPIMVRKGQEKTFTFDAMTKANLSGTATPYRYTLEYSSNPAWYAVQALPYLMEYPYECTEQILSRYYANTLAAYIANSNPKIKAVFERWKNTDALLSNLQKNQELKSALLEETPWVLEAQSEEQQKKNIGLLFDFNRMANEQQGALRKLMERQYQSGGLPWFPGCRENEYVTSYVVENLGHLLRLGVIKDKDASIYSFLERALNYCDQALVRYYEDIKRDNKNDAKKMDENHLSYWPIQYLYARSMMDLGKNDFQQTEAYRYFFNQSKKYWNKKNQYAQGMIALYLHRAGDKTVPGLIVEGMRQTAFRNPILGMYWKSDYGYFWYQLPIETQALMIEVFSELTQDADSVDEMKMWLLLNKQTNNWKTTKATSSAIYALLLQGGAMNLETVYPDITLGGKKLDIPSLKPEPGTGYFKATYSGKEISKEMQEVKVRNNSRVINWGGAYYQYFEQLDKIGTFKGTPLTIDKSYNIVRKGDRGETLIPLSSGQVVKVGDLIRVRTIIRVDRPMEYVHLKDMRPAGTEPISNISGYRFKNGLGYYESPKDIANNFFIDYLPKGTYVFEYDIRASLRGNFSTGISTIQCMYAPEFSSHSKGERMEIR